MIDQVVTQARFSYKDWSKDELMSLRSKVREFYRIEQKGVCPYCKGPISISAAGNATIEHILPKSKHIAFLFEPKNLCVICADCNLAKNDKSVINEEETETLNGIAAQYPRASDRFKIVHPSIDEYDDHIEIHRNKVYSDKTDKGGFTIQVCKLNRYTRKFGYEPEALSDYALFEQLKKFKEGTDLDRDEVMKKLRELIPSPS
ncbi:HNH endonuclease [Pseudomonas benzopyrenica]|uniref:HNH endonuclease n=1 Tax=Pseudomonas benzopyrenica TaxID=2993566 RepID=A0ABZ2FXI1_9PSED